MPNKKKEKILFKMLVLGIESTCDETAAAVVKDGHEIPPNSHPNTHNKVNLH